MMRWAKLLAAMGLVAMTAVLAYGFVAGDLFGEGSQLLAMPWGLVSMVDLYVGFSLFSAWVVYRGRSWSSAIWVVLVLVLGFWAASLYVLIALQRSGGDWRRFWMGRRASEA